MLLVQMVIVVLMVVANLVLVGVVDMLVVVVEMLVVVVNTSPRVHRGVGNIQQGEHRLPQPLHSGHLPTGAQTGICRCLLYLW